LNTKVLAVGSALNPLLSSSGFLIPKVSFSGPSVATATVTGNPTLGSYKIQVQSLGAQGHMDGASGLSRVNTESALTRAGFAKTLATATLEEDGTHTGTDNVRGTSASVRVADPDALAAGPYAIDVANVATHTVARSATLALDPERPLSDAFPGLTWGGAVEINGASFIIDQESSLNDFVDTVNAVDVGVTASFEEGVLSLRNDLPGADPIVFGQDQVGLWDAIGRHAQEVGVDADFNVEADGERVHYRSADNEGLFVEELPGLEFDVTEAGRTDFDVRVDGVEYQGGSFEVNGHTVSWRTSDSIEDVIEAVSEADPSVTLSYDRAADKFRFSGSGDLTVKDLEGGLLSSMGFEGTATGNDALESAGTVAKAIDKTQDVSIALRAPVTAGTFKINDATIQVKAGDSLDRVLSRITNSSAGVNARYDAAADRIVLQRKALGSTAISVGEDSTGFLAAAGLVGAETTGGASAQYTVDGVAHASDSLTVTDAIPGVSVTLTGTTPTTPADTTLEVKHDVTAGVDQIKAFVDSVNELMEFIADNSEPAVLEGSSVLSPAGVFLGNTDVTRLTGGLQRALHGIVAGQPSEYNSLSDIGISIVPSSQTGRGMQLDVDDAALREALGENPDALRELFAKSGTGVGRLVDRVVDQAARGSGLFGGIDLMERKLERLTSRAAALEERLARDQVLLQKASWGWSRRWRGCKIRERPFLRC